MEVDVWNRFMILEQKIDSILERLDRWEEEDKAELNQEERRSEVVVDEKRQETRELPRFKVKDK